MRKTITIKDMQEIAKKRGGKCLSDVYVNSQTHLLWECSKGHQWEAVPYSIKNGHWCPKCGIEKRAAKQRLSIEDMQKVAI